MQQIKFIETMVISRHLELYFVQLDLTGTDLLSLNITESREKMHFRKPMSQTSYFPNNLQQAGSLF